MSGTVDNVEIKPICIFADGKRERFRHPMFCGGQTCYPAIAIRFILPDGLKHKPNQTLLEFLGSHLFMPRA